MIELVPYRPAFAAAIAALWNTATSGRYPIMPDLWIACTEGDPSFRPTDVVLAMDGNTLVGVCLAKQYRGQYPNNEVYAGLGFVGLLAVHPDHQRRGLGSRLLTEAETRLRTEGVERMRLGGGYGHLFPGVPDGVIGSLPFFTAKGYAPDQEVWDVRADLSVVTLPELVLPEGFSLRPYRPDEADALVRFLDAAFAGRWAADTVDWIAAGRPLGDTMGLFEGDEPRGFSHLHPPGTVVARRWTGFNPAIAALGPIGIDASVRGRGLGLAILVAGLKALREQGATDTVIDWTTLLEFYGRCGFTPWIRYQLARKAFL